MPDSIRQTLAPTGVLRAAINMANFLLVTGKTAQGEPDGVSPELARAIGDELGVETVMVPFKGPGELADAVAGDVWDIGNIAAEPERARTITFSPAYCEIQATYLVPPGSPVQQISAVDVAGNRIAVKARSAYDLWLSDNLEHAQLVRTDTIDESFELFARDGLEVLAGLRPKLIEQQRAMPGSTLFDESFTAVQQSVGCRPGNAEAAAFLRDFVVRAIDDGTIAALIEKHGVTGRLSVAPRPA